MRGFDLDRVAAVMIKEFKQLTRDRLTYAMMLGLPVIQLLLFGYAINTEPRHLPTAVLVQEDSIFARSMVSALPPGEKTRMSVGSRPHAAAETVVGPERTTRHQPRKTSRTLGSSRAINSSPGIAPSTSIFNSAASPAANWRAK